MSEKFDIQYQKVYGELTYDVISGEGGITIDPEFLDLEGEERAAIIRGWGRSLSQACDELSSQSSDDDPAATLH